MDSEKSGYVKHELFFEILGLHKVCLEAKAINYLKQSFSINQTINYKDALNSLTIDLQAAAGSDPEARDGEMKWTVFGLQPKAQTHKDTVS